jgi:hypothetical protein
MRFLLILLLFIALYYMLSKYVFPYLLQRFIRKAQQRFNESQKEATRPEGDVNVDYVPPKAGKNKYNPDSIEDVDFEEVKEK